MSHWLSENGKHAQSWGRNIHEWISSLPLNHWLSDLGVGTSKEVFKKAGWGIAAYVWDRTKARRDKLTAYLKTFRKKPVQLPQHGGRTASIGMSFSTPTPNGDARLATGISFSPQHYVPKSALAAVNFSTPTPTPTGISFPT